jgi:hypothetical protein
MSLSSTKLQQLLSSNGFQIKTYFTENKCCYFVDVVHPQSNDNFLVYIPCKYNIQVDGYEMTYIHIQDFDNLTNEYTGKDKQNLEHVYGDMKIEILDSKDNIEKQLENRYKHEIVFPEIPKDDNLELKSIYRQIKRLKYSVENLKYKIAILYKNYICSIRRNGMIDFFKICKYPNNSGKKLFIIIDLETFFDKSEDILKEIKIIRTNLYSILDKTQTSNLKIIHSMVNGGELQRFSGMFETKKNIYDEMINKLETMLTDASIVETAKVNEFNGIQAIASSGLQSDINRVHKLNAIKKELEQVITIKQEIQRNIEIIRGKKENSMLDVDKIIFDNTVMYDCIIKNFSKLEEFYK